MFKQLQIFDPYRWLEKTDSNETQTFIDAENKVTESFLKKVGIRNKVKEKLVNFWNQTKIEIGARYGKYYFSSKNTGLQKQE